MAAAVARLAIGAAAITVATVSAGPVSAQEVPPPAYQIAAQRAGVPSPVLYAIALQESGVRQGDRIVPWPWTLNVAGAVVGSRIGPRPASA